METQEIDLFFFYEAVSYWWLFCEAVICSQTEITSCFGKLTLTFRIVSFKAFSQLDRLDRMSHRFTRLHTVCMRASVCLCVALRSGGSRLSLDVTSDIVTWPLELYYSWDQCWDSTRPDTVQPFSPEALPLQPSSSIFLRRLFSLHGTLFCWDWVVRAANMKTESVHLKGMTASETQWGGHRC